MKEYIVKYRNERGNISRLGPFDNIISAGQAAELNDGRVYLVEKGREKPIPQAEVDSYIKPSPGARRSKPMQTWEYCYLYLFVGVGGSTHLIWPDGNKEKVGGKDIAEAIKFLNRLGAEGWEVVGYGTYLHRQGFPTEMWTLKRSIG